MNWGWLAMKLAPLIPMAAKIWMERKHAEKLRNAARKDDPPAPKRHDWKSDAPNPPRNGGGAAQ